MIDQWKHFVLDRVTEWNLPQGGEWTFLLHNNYHPQCTTLNVLWFHNGERFPRVVAKLYRESERVKQEFKNLVQVHQSAPAWVPKPLHFGAVGEYWALWMEGVPGSSFSGGNGNTPRVLRSLVEMLVSLHRAVRNSGGSDPGRYQRMVVEPLDTVARFGTSASVRMGCANLAAESSAEWLNSLPVIPQHGDLCLGNLFLEGDRWYVLDWESFSVIDLPFYDLLTLLYSMLRQSGESPDRWDPALVKQVPGLIERYAAGLGLSRADVSRLLPLALANWFHLHWSDSREAFTSQMYQSIRHYFERVDGWQKVFLSI
jgi:aminoglycoside phosphotransferase (APT) family kinase protein